MSNIIPPLLSDTPPPIIEPLDEDEDEDEFGDYNTAIDLSYDNISPPPSTDESPAFETIIEKNAYEKVDLNSNSTNKSTSLESADKIENENHKRENNKNEIFQLSDLAVSKNSDKNINLNVSLITDSTLSPNFENKQDSEFNITSYLSSNEIQSDCAIPIKVLSSDEDEIVVKNDLANFENGNKFAANVHHFTVENDSEVNTITINSSIENVDSELPTNTLERGTLEHSHLSHELSKTSDNKDDIEKEKQNCQIETSTNEEFDDEFGDFTCSELRCHSNTNSDISMSNYEEIYDYRECADFINSQEEVLDLSLEVVDIFKKSEHILKQIFPLADSINENFVEYDIFTRDSLFNELKDVVETNASFYQWSKSASQNVLLNALNIDMRNILYGPSWTSTMPKFAANLGLVPLEPVKSEAAKTNDLEKTVLTTFNDIWVVKPNADIPSVEFDWSVSGLINPLDSVTPKELESANVSTEKFGSSISSSNIDLNSIDFDKCKHISHKSGKTKTDDGYNQSTIQPSTDEEHWVDMIPLRETHISHEIVETTEFSWLQPTILTPELPRKDTVDLIDEEFDQFQMVLPKESSNVNVCDENSGQDKKELNLLKLEKSVSLPSDKCIISDDEEFTDFHSFDTINQPTLQPQLLSTIQLLTPAVVHSDSLPKKQINWPSPGISDDDLKKLELTFSLKSDSNIKEKKQDSVSIEDDEWSDFVSVQQFPKVNLQLERTATPDLPLSVLNLSQVQPAKQPVPVITHDGLIQTKLSSVNYIVNSTINQSPKHSKISNLPSTLHNSQSFKPLSPVHSKPSIISEQFACQAYKQNFETSNYYTGCKKKDNMNKMKTKVNLESLNNSSQNPLDDDDWSDFKCGQPSQQTPSSFQQPATLSKTNEVPSESNSNTCIISNLEHFDILHNSSQISDLIRHDHNRKHIINQDDLYKKLTISDMCLPDLGFANPKRTNRK